MRVFKVKDDNQLSLVAPTFAEAARDAVQGGPIEIVIRRPDKSRDQEAKYHAMIGDIARTVPLNGKRYDREVWKAMLVHEFEKEMREAGTPLRYPGRVVLSLGGESLLTLRSSTKGFTKKEASQFIEFLYAFGVEHGARFSDDVLKYYESISGGNNGKR